MFDNKTHDARSSRPLRRDHFCPCRSLRGEISRNGSEYRINNLINPRGYSVINKARGLNTIYRLRRAVLMPGGREKRGVRAIRTFLETRLRKEKARYSVARCEPTLSLLRRRFAFRLRRIFPSLCVSARHYYFYYQYYYRCYRRIVITILITRARVALRRIAPHRGHANGYCWQAKIQSNIPIKRQPNYCDTVYCFAGRIKRIFNP